MNPTRILKNVIATTVIAGSVFSVSALAAPGDRHVVDGDVINLRSGPSTQHAIAFRLHRGAPLVEVSRTPKWIQVDTAGGRAWIYAKLTKQAPPKAETKNP